MATRTGLEDLPEELGVDFGLRCRGGLTYFTTEAQAVVMREFVERRTADGVPMQLLDGDEARELAPILPGQRARAPRSVPLTPRSTRAVSCAPSRSPRNGTGATIREGTAVRTLEVDGSRITRVQTDLGPITAGQVVLATGAWSPDLGASSAWSCRSTRCGCRSSRPSRCPRASTSSSTARRRSSSTPSSRSSTASGRSHSRPTLEERLGLALLESACQTADGSYLLGIAMDYPGLRLEADLAGVVAGRPRVCRPPCPSCAPPGSRAPGPASCRSRPTTCRSSAGPRATTT